MGSFWRLLVVFWEFLGEDIPVLKANSKNSCILDRFGEGFGDPGPSKMSVSLKRNAIFSENHVFQTRFGFGLIFDFPVVPKLDLGAVLGLS